MADAYIYLLFIVPPVILLGIAARMVIRFLLITRLTTVKDRLNSLALHNPAVRAGSEYAFAVMQNNAHRTMTSLGMNRIIGGSLFRDIDAAEKANRSRSEKRGMNCEDIKDQKIRAMAFSSMASFIGLLAMNSAKDFCFCVSAFCIAVCKHVASEKKTGILNEAAKKMLSYKRYKNFNPAAFAA